MSLIRNETLKLQANALDRASTACLTVGVLAPVAAVVYDLQPAQPSPFNLVIGTILWIFAALALHLAARRTLKGLTT